MICVLFGHKDSLESVKLALELAVKQTIEHYPDTTFYVEHNGSLDGMALYVLKKLSKNLPRLSYAVILTYLLTDKNEIYSGLPTVYPRVSSVCLRNTLYLIEMTG